MKKKIAIIIGSLRQASNCRKVANELIRLAPEEFSLHLIESGDLPLYNEDLEGENIPESWKRFRSELSEVEGVIFVTPEYNRGTSAAMANAIEVGSRPPKMGVLNGKPAGVIAVTPGAMGAAGGAREVRSRLVPLNMPTLQQPEVYISKVKELYLDDGSTLKEETQELLKKFLGKFAEHIQLYQ
ncbi:NADPH-dependent FMN reductase [Cruoricaptor ignavus]|nr:NAD(P)H-dependent oxidoreductase [Cruoricaptor ignavus]